MNARYVSLCKRLLVALLASALAGAAAASDIDSRANSAGPPAEETPWWPSRYGADDQLGTLNEINWITEIQAGTFQAGTQLDSIGHIQIGDRFYNGWTTRDVVESWGLNRFGIETVPPILTRGVLMVPQTMYVKMGLFGLENLATEELLRRGVYEFLFTLTHAKTRGSTAAIIAPAAVY